MTAMRRLFGALILGLALLAPPSLALADPAAESQAVIERQLEAFQRDDWAGAFAFASPGIQRLFGGPDRFGQMVRSGYPMVWRPAEVTFLGAEAVGPYLEQRLRITDGAGQVFIARYRMEQVGGAWRIAGVEIERAPDLGA